MCDVCDGPPLALEDYVEHVRRIAERDGLTVQSVQGSVRSAEFSYTVGLTAHALPELVVTGLRRETAVGLLLTWGHYLLEDSLVLPGETLEAGSLLMQAVEVVRPQDHLFMATRLYGEGVRGLQLAWADERGFWPWEPEHRGRKAGQPVLGEPAPFYCCEHRPDRLDVPAHLE